MKFNRLLAVTLLSLLSSTVAFATPESLIENADGDLTLNHSAAIVSTAMVPVLPHLGDSGLDVKTNLKIDRDASVLTLSLTADKRGRGKVIVPARNFTCDVFSMTAESSDLYVSKNRMTRDLMNGSRRDTTIRGECKDQFGATSNIVVSYDSESYSILINDDTLKTPNPRFDLVIGPLPIKP
jgi:hypothetical protein